MSDKPDAIIHVENLTVAYDEETILEDISFEVLRSEIFIILGVSGSGKSTLMKHIIGLYRPRSGTVLIEGENIVTAHGHQRHEILRKFGVMYQSGALFGSMTVLENVRLPLEEFTNLPTDAMNLISMMKLQQVGLKRAAHLMPSELSGGMQKRAAIARAMVLDPKILFLDEPSSGLDPVTSAEIDQLILNLAGTLKITFVVVTHELPSIYAIADRVIMLDRESKSIVATGHPEELRHQSDNPKVVQFFNRQASARSS